MKIIIVASVCLVGAFHAEGDPLLIHEWGTFTSLQDETGRALGGINSDEERLPSFVHDIGGGLIAGPSGGQGIFSKGIMRCHPDMTMRLETPVIYFYPQPNGPTRLSLEVRFPRGWLTQFYPVADPKAPGLHENSSLGRITPETSGSLTWRDLEIGGAETGPPSDDRVWTSPRAVSAANVKTSKGEAERFLFYRGVGNVDAPLRVVREAAQGTLQIRGNESFAPKGLGIADSWLVQLRGDGSCAFQIVPPMTINAGGELLAVVPARFAPSQFSVANLTALRAQMHAGLMREGLFADEATALLTTWEQSYFKSAGLRLFFLLPQTWTDRHLPMEISVPATVRRVMVGRIEIVTPEQREIMQELAEASKGFSLYRFASVVRPEAQADEALRLAYRNLGRFRDALLLDEQQMRPSPGLANLLQTNGLQYAQ